nr:hypothetical protein OG409_25860 [Streptomyces sp. NBC_00974]
MSDIPQQGSHQYVLTLQNRDRNICTATGTLTPELGSTRHDVFAQLRGDVVRKYPAMANPAVVFFSLEPNQI